MTLWIVRSQSMISCNKQLVCDSGQEFLYRQQRWNNFNRRKITNPMKVDKKVQKRMTSAHQQNWNFFMLKKLKWHTWYRLQVAKNFTCTYFVCLFSWIEQRYVLVYVWLPYIHPCSKSYTSHPWFDQSTQSICTSRKHKLTGQLKADMWLMPWIQYATEFWQQSLIGFCTSHRSGQQNAILRIFPII